MSGDVARAIADATERDSGSPFRICDVVAVSGGIATLDYSGAAVDIVSDSWYCWRDPVAGDVVVVGVNGSERLIIGIRR